MAYILSTLALFWYAYDDSLAAWLNQPLIGDVPFPVWFWIWAALEFWDQYERKRQGMSTGLFSWPGDQKK